MADYYVDVNGNITTKKNSKKKKKQADYIVDINGKITTVKDDDIAPVKKTNRGFGGGDSQKERTWFQKSELFDDGYQFGDLTKTILGSTTDVGENASAGIIGMGEKALDALMWASTYMAQGQYYSNGGGYSIAANQAFDQAIDLAKSENEKFIAKDLYDEEEIAKKIISEPVKNLTGIDAETDSVFGEKSDALAQSAGQLGATVALSAVGVPWYLTTGLTSFGGETENALKQGATMEEAGLSAAITAGAEILTEKLSGGISFGGKTLDDGLTRELARTISDKTLRTMAKLGMDATGEGAEEVISQVFSNLGSALYKEESLDEILFSEEAVDEYIESFIGGAVLGGGSSAINAVKSSKQGVDATSGLTDSEQKVVDKVYADSVAEAEKEGKISEKEKRKIYDRVLENMEKGYISTDTIEEILGGDAYTAYKSTVESEDALLKEFDELYKTKRVDMSEEQADRLAELKPKAEEIRKKNMRSRLKYRLNEQVSSMVKDSRLVESYNERTRKGQAFEADLTQYKDEKQKAIVQKAAESGILNNTRRTHEFVDMVAKIAADKGVSFDFTNNAKLKDSGFAIDGKMVNGFVTKDGVTVNVQSVKALNSVVGHEITHVLEGTELYNELRTAAIEYAKAKDDYQGRYDALVNLYEKGTDIDAELTADIVGEYLFTDSDFIDNLSTNHRNVFEKIYDEIKYLLKVATAGSKEARELEKVKKAFDKAYRDGGNNKTAEDGGVKYSLRKDIVDVNGKEYDTVVELDKTVSKRTLSEPKRFLNYIEKNLVGLKIPVADASGNIEVIEFAGANETVTKNGKRHPALGELAYTKGDTRKQVIVNAKEVIEESAHDPVYSSASNEHGWLDKNGWESRTTYVLTQDGMLYQAYLKIAKTQDGRNILYAVNLDINKGIAVDKGATSKKAAVLAAMPSGDMVAQESGEVKYSLGYHAGDLGKAESYAEQGGYRDTGHFGTGTYFVGDEAAISQGSYGKRPHHAVEFDNYNLYKARTDKDGYALHSQLRVIDGGFTQEFLDSAIADKFRISELRKAAWERQKVYDTEEWNDELEMFVSSDYFGASTRAFAEVAEENDIDVQSYDEWLAAQDDDVPQPGDSDYEYYRSDYLDYLKKTLEDVDKERNNGYEDFRDAYFQLWLRFGKDKVNRALQAVIEHDAAMNPEGVRNYDAQLKADSRATVFMKALGYEGVDVRGTSLDNTTYGSVIYDLKGEDAKKKADIGTAKFSLSPETDADYMVAVERGDTNTAQMMVDEAAEASMPDSKIRGKDGNLIPVYHGTKDMFYEFDTSVKGGVNGTAEGFGIYTSDDSEVTSAYGERQIKMYANITKPATSDKKTISPAKLAALIKDTCKKQAQQAVEDGEYDSVQDALMDTWVSNYVYTYGIGMERAYREVAKSILEMNDSDMAVIQEVMSGMAIRDYAEATDFYRDSLIPITGFDGFVTHWENSATGKKSNIYLAFDSSQLKSADAVTYDDNGNVIPLSERFNSEKKDIRNSLSSEDAAPVADRNYGKYHVYGSDIALEEAVAPVRQDNAPTTASKTETVADIAPMRADVAAYEEPAQAENPYAELDRLNAEMEELERQMYEAMDAGEHEKATEINADLVDAAIRYTKLEQQLDAEEQDRLASFTDADAPAVSEAPYSESTDTVTLPKKLVQDIARDARKALGFKQNRVQEMRDLVEKFNSGEIDSEQLYDEIAYRFGRYTETNRNEDIAEVRKWLRTVPINVSEEVQNNFADYAISIMRPNRGRLLFSKKGTAVDVYYAELSNMFPAYFPSDIISSGDQLNRIVEVANMDINSESVYVLDEQTLDDVTDNIIRSVNEYRQSQRIKMAEDNSREAYNSLMADADSYAPVLEDDIAPVRADVTAPVAEAAAPVVESAPVKKVANQPIQTVKQRLEAKLHNFQTELENNRQYREQSRSDYEAEIARKQAEYDSRKNKNTKSANDILRSIERMRRIAGNIDADFAKKISDLEAKVAQVGEELRSGESTTEQGAMRRELHAQKVDEIRSAYAERGYDFDTVLENAKDLSTLATVDNTPQRVMEKALGYKEGQILADMTVNKVAANETEGIKWLNSYTERKGGLLAQISKQYSIKPRSKESAAAQMYAEGFYVAENGDIIEYGDRELAKDFPDAKVQANIKGLARDPRIRQIYDETLELINASRTRNAYPEIKKLDNYFLHFRAMDDTFSKLGIPFNPNDIRAKDLPTDLNGVTADLKPGQPYFASAMHRRGQRTSFDLLGGLEQYLTSAKDQIYHIDDIQTLRALRNHIADTYGQAKGLEGLDALTEEEAQAKLEQVYGAHLSTFAKFLNEEANVIAGKTALIDRGLEGIIGRRGMTFFDTLNRQVGANMVGFNVSSSLTNFIAPVQAFAKTNKAAFVKGFAQTVANRVASITGKSDGFAESNPTMIRRQGADRFSRTPWQKVSDVGYALMGGVDSISTEIIVRSKINEYVKKGMDADRAVIEADKWASRLMGDRSLGQQPQLYNSKMAGLVTKFQLEVRNQLDSQFYDTIQEAKVSNEDIENAKLRNAKTAAQVASTFVQLAVVQHLFGKAFEAVAGYNPAFDIIEAIIKAFGWDDEEDSEDTVLDNLGQGLMSIAEDMPYYSVLSGTGRIPISSALPIGQFVKGEDKYGNEKSRWETLAETAPYYLLPGGYGQIKKTTQGLGMFDEDLPVAGSYTDSGNLRFPVEDTLVNRAQAALFGQYASSNAREYFDNEYTSLKKNQIQELVDSGLSVQEYRDYREGLKGKDTLGEKVAYIASLDMPISTKNLLVNNIADREEPIDLTNFGAYDDWGEFEYAHKYPKKYDFLQANNISVEQYENFDEDTKEALNWAYQNPEKYTVSKSIASDVTVYRQYTKALNKLEADKDASGKSISGSRKEKVINYINGLDADYGEKIILFKSEYNSDDTYNYDIIEYLNGRSDISYEEEVTILKELGFVVLPDGTVQW